MNAVIYMSDVRGSENAISNTQQSSARYFQRPDASHLTYDSTRTSLSGLGGKLEFGKIGGNWNFLFMNTFKSPGLEINDMGYMREADNILNVLWSGYHFTEPFSIFRNLNLNNDIYLSWDFGGNVDGLGYEYNINGNFKNFWYGGFGGGFNFNQVSSTMLRGGPAMLLPNSSRFNYWIGSDDRKNFTVFFSNAFNWGSEDYFTRSYFNLEFTYRPLDNLSLSIEPSYSGVFSELQYIGELDYGEDSRYIFGTINQKVLSASIRINLNITPDLTVQYWGQPFIASGNFSDFKMITDTKAPAYIDRFHVYSEDQLTFIDDTYAIDENMDGSTDYDFGNPDFTFDEWLSNLVIRWEFLPGSTAYLVWSQSRDYGQDYVVPALWDSMNSLFTEKKATNTLLLKVSYRFGLR